MSETLAVGIMSGTSLDGVSTALVGITDVPPRLEVRLAAFHQEAYSAAERGQIVDTIARAASSSIGRLRPMMPPNEERRSASRART